METKLKAMEDLVAWVRQRREERVKYVDIDLMLGCPAKWGGRLSWLLANRPRQPWEAPGTAPELKPAQPRVSREQREQRDAFSFARPGATRFCSACGTPLAGPFCAVCGTRAVAVPAPAPEVYVPPAPVAETPPAARRRK